MTLRSLSLLVVLAGMTSCSRSGVDTAASPSNRQSTLYVQNLHWDTVRIYFLPDNGSSAERIGSVDGSSSESIEVKGQFASAIRSRGRVRLLLRPLASTRDFVTSPVVISPGGDLQLYVQLQLDMSYVIPTS